MPIQYTTAASDEDLRQIMALQRRNLYKNTPVEYQKDQGFTTVEHSFAVLKEMNEVLPQIIAKDGEALVGYALVMPRTFGQMVPELVPMFDIVAELNWQGKTIGEHRFYVMGQICVAESHRGQGIFDGLYAAHKKQFSTDFDICVTEVAVRNTRSQRAHERVGFRTIYTYEDYTDVWNVVVWDWH
ncbi:GNAT family N-acetyltransferase [Runella slithyformis]|uniref:GCN5-related N-acetyltransferase n=1 Tax=Runella slithyformis (strain ATCC 29530 / DSM 19594 / LMG 11500 / NCIMB 11436 / LSU 4) TaxID=761193 RepID=A0A7U4E769_RUNSL|nr:GNAT family N-acetyltransferase [Runella slithyformis]AEI50351.1 GCN5-related N-acetyltransferase [Runella slithyformis DSM 19594]